MNLALWLKTNAISVPNPHLGYMAVLTHRPPCTRLQAMLPFRQGSLGAR